MFDISKCRYPPCLSSRFSLLLPASRTARSNFSPLPHSHSPPLSLPLSRVISLIIFPCIIARHRLAPRDAKTFGARRGQRGVRLNIDYARFETRVMREAARVSYDVSAGKTVNSAVERRRERAAGGWRRAGGKREGVADQPQRAFRYAEIRYDDGVASVWLSGESNLLVVNRLRGRNSSSSTRVMTIAACGGGTSTLSTRAPGFFGILDAHDASTSAMIPEKTRHYT